ncbi:hypothetical protein TrLO_g10317 [Triparma laevis f. longispina]|uniref:Uncharacterized protein n=1 Tax=Triparma laevis f. longispina TaxID=1714387 RepID=A0A9W7L099_9STRA|nr:hypothetical protein TrLO_g10317 [Triparma laevis f. longispina]
MKGLSFKNGGSLKDYDPATGKKKKAKKKKSSSKHSAPGETSSSSSKSSAPSMSKTQGTGHVLHSGSIVTGLETKFQRQLSPGDALILQNPSTGSDEMRVVRLIVSDTNLSLSSGYSFSGGGGSCRYWFISAPKAKKSKEEEESEEAQQFNQTSDKASGATGSGTVEIRVKNGSGGYNITRETVGAGVSREEMLGMRAKKKSDKFC